MFVLWSSPNHKPIKDAGSIKKTSHVRPIHLHGDNYHPIDGGQGYE